MMQKAALAKNVLGRSGALYNQSLRAFSIAAPQATLHFIDHPRYGKVYPVVCMNDK